MANRKQREKRIEFMRKVAEVSRAELKPKKAKRKPKKGE